MSKKYTVLFDEKNLKLDLFLELLKENRLYARVHCINNGGFHKTKVVLYEEENGDFAIVQYLKKFNITKTNKVYTKETNAFSLIYKDKKFWFVSNNTKNLKKFRQLTLSDLHSFNLQHKLLITYLTEKFPWIRYLVENNINCVSLNYFINNKLYSLNDFLKFYFKMPLPAIKLILSDTKIELIRLDGLKRLWNRNKNVLLNIENLRKEFIDVDYFDDTVRLAILFLEENYNSLNQDLLIKELDRNWDSIVSKASTLKLSRSTDFLRNSDFNKLTDGSNQGFYWLGFLLADGHFNFKSKRITLSISMRDTNHMLEFCKFVNTTNIRYNYERKMINYSPLH